MVMFDGTDSPTVSVAFDTGRVGIFTLGVSTLGGTDLLGAFATTWTTLPATDVLTISTRRGRTQEDQNVQPGTLTLTLDNVTGKYDPDNISSVWNWNGYSMLTRGLGVRVQATWAATPYTIYRGYLEDGEADQSLDPVATFTFTDALAWLGAQNLADLGTPSFSGDTTATRVGRILDAVGWDASLRSLTGSRQMQPTQYKASGLALAEEAAMCEFGRFYADRSGSLVLMPWESTFFTTQRLAFSDQRTTGTIEYDVVKTGPGSRFLANSITLTQATGVTVSYTNAASIARYGTYYKSVTAPLLNGTDASTMAQIMGDRYAFPATRVTSIEFDALGVGANWPNLLQSDLGDNVTVGRTTVDGRARTYATLIESLNHDITPDGWRVTLDLSPASTSTYFILGTSLLGGADGLYY